MEGNQHALVVFHCEAHNWGMGLNRWPVGQALLSVTMNMSGYHTTSGGAVTVGPDGLVGQFHEYTFQSPRDATFAALKAVLPAKLNDSACHVVSRP